MRLLALLLALALQNSPQNPLGRIEGSVTRTSATGAAIAGVRVKVSDLTNPPGSPTAFSAATTTDTTGRFTVPDVPAGRYEIEIAHDDFGYRQSDAVFKTAVMVAAGQSVRVPAVSLVAAGVIYGHVLDAEGKGVSAAVEILRVAPDGVGRKIWAPMSGRVFTDTQGAYRKTVFGSGDYYVRAVVESGPVPLTVYYPATTESNDAAPVILVEGSEKVADIQIGPALADEGFQISGKVMLPPVDVASPFIELVLTRRGSDGPGDSFRTSSRANDGAGDFEFRGIRPGNYELSASARIDGRSYTAKTPIGIRDRDMDGVELVVHPPLEVRGRLVIDGEAQDVQLSRPSPYTGLSGRPSGSHAAEVGISLTPKNSLPTALVRLPSPIIDPTGTSFSFSEIQEGEYKITATLLTDGKLSSQNLYIADIRAGGRSVIDSGLQVGIDPVDLVEVVIGTKGGTIIEGRIAGDGSNLPAMLLLVPEKFRESNSSPSQITILFDGHFQISGIAPGNYKIFAVPYGNESKRYQSAEFIAQYESRALSITVKKGMTSGGLQVPYVSLDK